MEGVRHKIETYIFVHDQDILLHCENTGNFNNFENRTYVLLGFGEVNKINHLKNLIIARDLPNNLEKHPKMCAYSGWYVLFKNDIVKSEYVNLFEYDTIICENFSNTLQESIEPIYDFYSYVPVDIYPNFIDSSFGSKSLIEYYPNLINNIYKEMNEKNIKTWASTSNITMKVEFFNKYMSKSLHLFNYVKNKTMAGHELERNLSVFQILEDNINVKYLPEMLKHIQLDSHKTQGLIVPNYKDVII